MGRPIQKRWFLTNGISQDKLLVTAKVSGQDADEGVILEQTGTRKYKVKVNGVIGDVFLVNKTESTNLEDGEAFILVTVSEGDVRPAYKIQQYRLSTFNEDGTFSHFAWNSEEADVQVSVTDEIPLPSFTVTFNIGDGTLSSGELVQEVDQGESATAPTIAAPEGYTFEGWDVDFTNVQSDITVAAQYEEVPTPVYTVMFDTGSGTLVSGDLSQQVEEGQSATAPTVEAPEGYTLEGWDADFSNVQADMVIAALYQEIPVTEYTVTFDIGDGNLVNGDLVQQVEEGQSAVAPTIEAPEGFEFTEWSGEFSDVQADVTITAQYTEVQEPSEPE